jgi:hypothetical protein
MGHEYLQVSSTHTPGSQLTVSNGDTVDVATITLSTRPIHIIAGFTVAATQNFVAWLDIDGTAYHYVTGANNSPVQVLLQYPLGIKALPGAVVTLKATNKSGSATADIYGTIVTFIV